jgi:hypothetical protein
MRSMTNLLGAVAAIVVMAGAGSASALTLLTPIDQPTLSLFGSATFGATITDLGAFSNSFAFTTTGVNDALASAVTIQLKTGGKDIDLSSVFLDGYAFTQTGFDPDAETWGLTSGVLSAGLHHINLTGNVITTGPGLDAASYSGTLNLAAVGVPEPTTWALMIMGFGGAGAMLRSRRRMAVATAA